MGKKTTKKKTKAEVTIPGEEEKAKKKVEKSKKKEKKKEKFKNTEKVTVQRELEVKLTKTELAARGKQTGELKSDLNKLESEFVTIRGEFKSKIQLVKNDIDTRLDTLKTGLELREVDCTEVRDFKNGKVEIWRGNDCIESRDMHDYERQGELAV